MKSESNSLVKNSKPLTVTARPIICEVLQKLAITLHTDVVDFKEVEFLEGPNMYAIKQQRQRQYV